MRESFLHLSQCRSRHQPRGSCGVLSAMILSVSQAWLLPPDRLDNGCPALKLAVHPFTKSRNSEFPVFHFCLMSEVHSTNTVRSQRDDCASAPTSFLRLSFSTRLPIDCLAKCDCWNVSTRPCLFSALQSLPPLPSHPPHTPPTPHTRVSPSLSSSSSSHTHTHETACFTKRGNNQSV